MAFKFKDLMINVLPAGQAVQLCGHTYCICGTYPPTICGCSLASCPATCVMGTCGCASIPYSGCPPGTVPWHCGGCSLHPTYLATPPLGVPPDPAALAALKEQLKAALADVEKQEQAAAQAFQPQTVEEAEQLETKLTEALAELMRHKEDLRKRKT